MTRTAAGLPRLASGFDSAPPAAWDPLPAPAFPPLAVDGEELVGFDDVHPTYPRTAADKARAAQGRKSIRVIVCSFPFLNAFPKPMSRKAFECSTGAGPSADQGGPQDAEL